MKRPNCPNCSKPMASNGKTPGGKTRWRCGSAAGKHCHSTTSPTTGARKQDGTVDQMPVFRFDTRSRTRFIVTAAQNATPVHKGAWLSLVTAARHLSAQIIVIPLRYANRESKYEQSRFNDTVWAPEVQPYLFNQRKNLHKHLTLLADLNPTMTNISPLSGYEAFTHGESGIIGHPKLQLATIPSPQNKLPKIMTTTGVVTVPNYSSGKTGKLGEFHHTLGACLVELDGKRFHIRQLNCDKTSGSFVDLDKLYTFASVRDAGRAEALVLGDVHREFVDPAAWEATRRQILELNPKRIIWHDVMDAFTVNPHHGNNVFNKIAKIRGGKTDVGAEVASTIGFIVDETPPDTESIVVFSNHPEMLARWVVNTDPRQDPGNLEFWCDTAKIMSQGARVTKHGIEYPDPFIYWGERITEGLNNIRFLRRDESLLVEGVELGMHGDDGPNGSRGSRKNLRRIGVRSIIGHGHSPGIDEGCYQGGTLTPLRMDYTHGPGSWLNTNTVLYSSGKRSLLNIINGVWRAE